MKGAAVEQMQEIDEAATQRFDISPAIRMENAGGFWSHEDSGNPGVLVKW